MRTLDASTFRPVQPGLSDAGPLGLSYRELVPDPALARDLVCCWEIDAAAPLADEVVYRIAPDACVDLVFDLDVGDAWVYGAQAAPMQALLAGQVALFGIRIRPGRLAGLLGHAAGAVAGDTVPLDALLGRRTAADWLDELADRRDGVERARVASRRLVAGRPSRALDPRATAVAEAIVAQPGRSVAALADDLGLSSRHLQRLCRTATGLAPKALARVVRFQAALRCLTSAPPPALADLAVALGYADQSHLGGEVRTLLGTTPAALVRTRAVSDFSKPRPHPPR